MKPGVGNISSGLGSEVGLLFDNHYLRDECLVGNHLVMMEWKEFAPSYIY